MAEDVQPGDNGKRNTVNLRLVSKGRAESLQAVVQQAHVHLELARKYAPEFAADGSWTSAETDHLARMVLVLESDASQRMEKRVGVRLATRNEQDAVTQSKQFIGRLRNALPRVMRDTVAAEVTMESFATGKTLGRSTPNISNYLNQIYPALVRLDDGLKRHFRNQKASELAMALKTALDQADADQEVKMAALPVETLQFYETKGRVLELMEDLIRAARNTFEGEPKLAAQFNKNLLKRSRPTSRAAGGKGDGVGDGAGAGGAASEPARREQAAA